MASPVRFEERPADYKEPSWDEVHTALVSVKRMRQPKIDHIWETKMARRGQWENVLRRIPRAYRKMLPADMIDFPQFRDMLARVTGTIRKNPLIWEVTPASPKPTEVKRAASEEARLHALCMTVEDQQRRPTYEMGIDSVGAWSESWVAVWEDPSRLASKELDRGDDEDGETYSKRFKDAQTQEGVQVRFEDYAPETVFPFPADGTELQFVIIESQHDVLDIELGLGYTPVNAADGEKTEWKKKSIGQPYPVATASNQASRSDTNHDTGPGRSSTTTGKSVKKVIYIDRWVCQTYIDGIKVEEGTWEHNYGTVPLFPAYAILTSDRDPAWASSGLADAALSVAKQIVFYSAILASQALQHGFPTPFLKNPAQGLVHPVTGEPLVRTVALGEMNLLGPNEEIEFPYLNAKMMPDFFQYMDMLTQAFEGSTVSNFGKAIGSDIAGYAVAQIRAMQMSILAGTYTSTAAQWRDIGYFIRHLIRTRYPSGMHLRGAVEEDDTGIQYRPIMTYAEGDITDFPINVHIDEGIQQDWVAEAKIAMELKQNGVWSPRRAMEKTGVEDPGREQDEIDIDRVNNSPAADQQKLMLAMALIAQRYQFSEEQKSSPLGQALEQAKQQFLTGGSGTGGSPQGGQPVNALPGGQPIQQGGAPVMPPQPGGPTSGPPALESLGIPGTPGGVKGVHQAAPLGVPP